MRHLFVLAALLFAVPAHAAPMFMGLGDLPGGLVVSEASGVSADGSVVVGWSCSDPSMITVPEAFIWTEETWMMGLGLFTSGFTSQAVGVSGDGLVVVGHAFGAGMEAVRWTEETGMVGLGSLPDGYSSAAKDVSADGSVIVGSSYGPFIWDSSNGMRDLEAVLTDDYGLDLTGWTLYYPTDISDDGLTIVG